MDQSENTIPTAGREALEHIYANAEQRANGHTIQYQGYTLEKEERPYTDHSQYAVRNRDGTPVESYTVHAFDSVDALQTSLDDLIAYDPDSIADWLEHATLGGEQ